MRTPVQQSVIVLAVVGTSVATSVNASATSTCKYFPNGSTYSPSTDGSPSITNCYFLGLNGPGGISQGPGASVLAQEQSTSTVSGTFAFEADSTYNTGIYAYSEYSNALIAGSSATSGTGVEGTAGATSLTPAYGYGVWGTSQDYDGVHGDVSNAWSGVAGNNTSTGPCTNAECVGVYGSSSEGPGVYASSTSSYGVNATSTNSFGVVAQGGGGGVAPPSNSFGVFATSASQNGIQGEVDNTWSGVAGVNDYTGTCSGVACVGVYAASAAAASYAVYAKSPESTAGYAAGYFYATANSALANGLAGIVDYNGTGGYFRTHGGYGVYAIDQGTSSSAYAVYGTSTDGVGVGGVGQEGVIGDGVGTGAYGIEGECSGTNCWAGHFSGNVNVISGSSYYYNGTTCVGGACSPSDERLKKNIQPLAGALDKLLQVKGVTYEWKNPDERDHPGGTHTGVIAQNVEKVFPEWVSETPDGVKVLNVDQRTMLGVTVEAFRTLKAENDLLKERVGALESGREPRISGFNLNGVGFGFCGLAIAGAVVFAARRKREDRPPQL